MITEEQVKLMKKGSYLINAARGTCVRSAELVCGRSGVSQLTDKVSFVVSFRLPIHSYAKTGAARVEVLVSQVLCECGSLYGAAYRRSNSDLCWRNF